MGNPLLARLRANDKKGIFTSTPTGVSYPTGFATVDYRNGYIFTVTDENDKIADVYPSIGIGNGCFNTIVGEAGTAKTTFCIQAAYNIIKPFEAGMVLHLDLEQSSNINRIRNITGMPRQDIHNRYILKQTEIHIDDIIKIVTDLYEEKTSNAKEYTYDTGRLDELGNRIKSLVPTVIILDSIKLLQRKGDANYELEGLTGGGRKALDITQMYEKLTPLLKAANITVLAINHLKDKIALSPAAMGKSQLIYMKFGKSMPGGKAPIYLASNVMYFEESGKYNSIDNGFDGFAAKIVFWKSRSNKSGQHCFLVYNQATGFDEVLSLYKVITDNGLVDGRNPKKYLKGKPDVFFDDRILFKELQTRPELQDAIKGVAMPILNSWLSTVSTEELELLEKAMIESLD